MSFSDISGNLAERLKKKREGDAPAQQPDRPVDFKELYALRARIHGLLIRDARLARGRSIEDCAERLGIEPQTFEAWELGLEHPSLPDLELLAYDLGVPISHFWSNQTLSGNGVERRLAQDEYLTVRNRMVGVQVAQAREAAGLSVDDLAEKSGLPARKLITYERGEAAIPLAELTTLASACGVSLNHFWDNHNRVGHWLDTQESFQHFNALDAETRAFLSNPTNMSFIKLAMWFSKLGADELRGIAESILHLSRLEASRMRQIAEDILNNITL